jgi:ribosomal protein S18 acetylase RimI-like enzyme
MLDVTSHQPQRSVGTLLAISPVTTRPMRSEDAQECGRIAFEAHQAVSSAHNLPSEHPSVEFSIGMMHFKLNDPHAYGVVAERDGTLLGSVFLTSFPPTPVAAIGPLSVHPSQEGKVGRQLMEAALDRAREQRFEGVRLVQSPSHLRSLALYTKLGFEVREPLLLMQGAPPDMPIGDRHVRLAVPGDVERCNQLCLQVHGIQREWQLNGAIQQHVATVVECAGHITGYAAGIGLLGHAVAETNDDLRALISHAATYLGPGFFIPTRNSELFRWLLETGFHGLWPATLMTMGRYQEPAGAFLPAISY